MDGKRLFTDTLHVSTVSVSGWKVPKLRTVFSRVRTLTPGRRERWTLKARVWVPGLGTVTVVGSDSECRGDSLEGSFPSRDPSLVCPHGTGVRRGRTENWVGVVGHTIPESNGRELEWTQSYVRQRFRWKEEISVKSLVCFVYHSYRRTWSLLESPCGRFRDPETLGGFESIQMCRYSLTEELIVLFWVTSSKSFLAFKRTYESYTYIHVCLYWMLWWWFPGNVVHVCGVVFVSKSWNGNLYHYLVTKNFLEK